MHSPTVTSKVRGTEAKQRALAEATVAERLQHLRDYAQQLLEAQADQRELYAEEVEATWRATPPWRAAVFASS